MQLKLCAIYRCLACVFSILGVCITAAQEKRALPQEVPRAPAVAVVLKPVGSNYFLGQAMPIELVLSNRSDAPVRLTETYYWEWDFPIAKLSITNSGGGLPARVNPGYERIDRFNGSARWTEVPPRGEKKWQMDLADKFIMTNVGSYSASARVNIPAQNGNGKPSQIETAPVNFEIKLRSKDAP